MTYHFTQSKSQSSYNGPKGCILSGSLFNSTSSSAFLHLIQSALAIQASLRVLKTPSRLPPQGCSLCLEAFMKAVVHSFKSVFTHHLFSEGYLDHLFKISPACLFPLAPQFLSYNYIFGHFFWTG